MIVDASTSKLSSSSEEVSESDLKIATDEVWLLWKMGEKEQAFGLITPLYEQYPNNIEVLHLAVLSHLERKDLDEVKKLISRMEALDSSYQYHKEVRISLALMEENWRQAAILIEEFRHNSPENTLYEEDYAYALLQMKRWKEAKGVYSKIIEEAKLRKQFIWNFRKAIEESTTGFSVNHRYNHSPESLRQHITTQKIKNVWIHPKVRTDWSFSEGIYTKRALGATGSIQERIFGHRINADWFIDDRLTLSGHWEMPKVNGESFHGFGIEMDYQYNKLGSLLSYEYGKLVRSPLEGISKKGRQDMFSFSNTYGLYDWLTIGHISQIEAYRLPAEYNQVNNKTSLGYKIVNDGYVNFSFWDKPYISFNMHFKDAHWNKSFEGAQTVLDFTGDEKVFYGGFYSQYTLGALGMISTSITRSFDEKRDIYSTISNLTLDVWYKDYFKTEVTYDYGYGISGTSGSGNEQQFNVLMDLYF